MALGQGDSNNSIKGVELNGVKIVGPNNFPFLDFLLLVLNKGTPPEDMFLKLFLGPFNLFKQYKPNRIIVGNNGRIDINLVLKLKHSLFGNSHVIFQIIDFHLIVLLDVVLALLLSTCCGLKQKTNLGLVDLEDSLDLFWREMVYGALLGFLP
mgnify:FL=1